MAGKLPVGIQDFVGLRRDEFVYVDKTAYIYRLAESGKQFFLSRPRRFGKSLFLSSLRAYWEGRKDLFQGLAIEAMESRKESPWQPHPVIYFDFNGANYREENALESILAYHLRQWERLYEIEPGENGLGERFQEVVKAAHQNSGRRVVVLVDEHLRHHRGGAVGRLSAGYYRLRVGGWRIIFNYPDDDTLMVDKIAPRGGAYKGGF